MPTHANNDSTMRKQYVGKNIAELRHTIDSVKVRIDSVGNIFGRDLQEVQYVGVDNSSASRTDTAASSSSLLRR